MAAVDSERERIVPAEIVPDSVPKEKLIEARLLQVRPLYQSELVRIVASDSSSKSKCSFFSLPQYEPVHLYPAVEEPDQEQKFHAHRPISQPLSL